MAPRWQSDVRDLLAGVLVLAITVVGARGPTGWVAAAGFPAVVSGLAVAPFCHSPHQAPHAVDFGTPGAPDEPAGMDCCGACTLPIVALPPSPSASPRRVWVATVRPRIATHVHAVAAARAWSPRQAQAPPTKPAVHA